METKRLFFGMETISPWPEDLPAGRILAETDRHLTLAFLGDVDLSRLLQLLTDFPKPPFSIGLAAVFDRPIFLPPSSPRVAAWHVHWLEQKIEFLAFQKSHVLWLKNQGFSIRDGKKEFLPHVTLARGPFVVSEWEKAFQKLPLYIKNIHLCESLGYSKYKVLWNSPMLAPFDEMEHTADLAFLIRGKNLAQLHLHAQLALSFYFPAFIQYFTFNEVGSLADMISSMNRLVAQADTEEGCPFKAVSFHGDLKNGEQFLEWEMIVDV